MALKREQVVRNAEKYVSRGKVEAAIKEYRKLLDENPNDANTLNRIGDLYARLERFDEAVKLFTQIADQYSADGFFVKAIAIYKKIIKLAPTNLQVYERLAELYHKQGLINEARTQYQVLADYYQKHSNAASTITIYQRMAEMEPENPTYHLKLAELYEGQRLSDKALREYGQLADLLLVGGSVDDAVQVYQTALHVDGAGIDFVRDAVKTLHDGGHVGAAAALLSKAVEVMPEARQLSREIGLGGVSEEESAEAAASEEVGEAAPTEPGEGEMQGEIAYLPEGAQPEATFDLPEASLAEIEAEIGEELGEPAAAEGAGETADEDDDEVGDDTFTFDLDDDEVPASLVTPPPDMLEAEEVPAAASAPEPPAAVEAEPEPQEEVGQVEVDWSLDEMPELELALPGLAAAEEPAPAVGPPPEAAVEAVAEAAPPAVEREADLLAEARVFAKYGLKEKAEDRLRELVDLRPEHLGGWKLMAALHLGAGEHEEVVRCANEVARLAQAAGDAAPWQDLRSELQEAGYTLEADRVVGAPVGEAPTANRIAHLLDSLSIEASPSPAAAEIEAKAPPRPPSLQEEATDRPRKGEGVVSLAQELDLGDIGAELAEVMPTAEERAQRAAGDLLDDSGMSWLDEGDGGGAAESRDEALFDEEDDFFDLASELERELREEEAPGPGAEEPQEQRLEDIIEGFKKGVAENLSPEDFDTHFNLGIAYREMGLLDEAIGEFQLASKDPRHLIDCSSMLGLCFLEKGLPELAIKWYRKGLESPSIREDASLGLLYDMGNAYATVGDADSAYQTFVEIYGINSNYRDVSTRLEELARLRTPS